MEATHGAGANSCLKSWSWRHGERNGIRSAVTDAESEIGRTGMNAMLTNLVC